MGSRVVIGVVVARSVEVPSPADAIFYTVEVDDGDQPVQYENMVPLDHYRVTIVDPSIDLVPFVVGQRVPVGVSTFGGTEYHDILVGEHGDAGPCEGEG